MTSDMNDKKDIKGDGTVILHKRMNRAGVLLPTWYMRIRIPLPQSKGYVRKSTNETNESRATQIALNTYDELYSKIKSGGTLQTITFKKLYELFCEYFPNTPKNKKRNKKYIVNFLAQLKKYPYEYFVKEKNNIAVDKINTGMIDDYFVYQMENTFVNGKKKEPSLNTINKYATALGMMFKFAYQRRYIQEEIHINKPSYKDERRPAFDLEDYRKLYTKMRDYIESNPQSNHYRARFYLQHFILISTNCGARVGEMRSLRWLDIQYENIDGEEVIFATVNGKTGQREIVFQPDTKRYFKNLKDFRKRELGKEVPEKEVLFCSPDGKPIHSFKKSYERMLNKLNLLYDKQGKKRTIYSLRHTYATFRLESNVDVYHLARQMGTSTQMIQMHYGQTETKRQAKHLTQTKFTRTSSKKKTVSKTLVQGLKPQSN